MMTRGNTGKKGKIKPLVLSLGIRSTIKGFHYIVYGLEKCLEDEDLLLLIYKDLYPLIAERYNSNVNAVEHCIRTAVDACWYRGNRQRLFDIAGYELMQKPKNCEFFDILYQYIDMME